MKANDYLMWLRYGIPPGSNTKHTIKNYNIISSKISKVYKKLIGGGKFKRTELDGQVVLRFPEIRRK